tara:strand:- start:30127 stop:30588 length:462 start_codon:yes stop_codon:yes gene_type:complete
MNWHVLYTKPRSEKKAEKQLQSIGIDAYCPTFSKISRWSDRKRKIDVPVLPSMVLVNINHNDLKKVFKSPLIVRYMFWLGKRAVVRQSEVDILKKKLNGKHNLINTELSNIKIGDIFKLSSFNNEKGIVNRISNNNIWIYIKSIGYNIKLELA